MAQLLGPEGLLCRHLLAPVPPVPPFPPLRVLGILHPPLCHAFSRISIDRATGPPPPSCPRER